MNAKILAAAILCASFSTALGQGSKADYERAAKIGQINQAASAARGEVVTVRPTWIEGQPRFWYKRQVGGRAEWMVVDAEAGTVRKAEGDEAKGFVNETTLSRRPRRTERNGESSSVTFVNQRPDEIRLFWVAGDGTRHPYGSVKPGESREQHTYAGHVWVAVGADGNDIGFTEGQDAPSTVNVGAQIKEPRHDASGLNLGPARAPGARRYVFVRGGELFFKPGEGDDIRLATTGPDGSEFRGEMQSSPDASRVVAMRKTPGAARVVSYIQSSPHDQLQPKVKTFDYLKPGDSIPQERPCLFDLTTRKEIPIASDLFGNPWDIRDLHWTPDSSRFMFVYNQRGHTVMRLLSVDATTGNVTPIVNEECKTFFDYNAKLFVRYLDKTDEVIWMSERDGWNHLYLIDSRTGGVKSQITRGEWVVRGVDRVDEERREIWFRAGGIIPWQDPYNIHFARVSFDGTGLTVLTEGDGTHRVDYSPDGRYLIDSYSRVDMPPVTALRRTSDGKLVVPLEAAPAYLTDARVGSPPAERFVAKGRDGVTDIWGIILRPSNFDPAKKYPVIEQIYAGPHDQHVPKSFRADWGYPGQIAELGFIVVQIDGMGTNWRSKAFHDVAWKNLKDAGFPDRIAWMKAAAAKHPEMDLENHGRGVGIYGGSAGGQNAMAALLWHGDFYKAAAADCGCHDNRMDKIWWNELWMSWPVGKEYEESSNVVNAHLLPKDCKLQLWVGEGDENVDPASTMQVVNALIKADKDFDLIVVPGSNHGSAESPYGRRRRMDFFVRSLMGKEPRWE